MKISLNIFQNLYTVSRFSAVGVLCTLISYITFVVFAARTNLILATILSWLSGITISFALNRKFTFNSRSNSRFSQQAIFFLLASTLQLSLASFGYWALIEKLNINSHIAYLINLLFTTILMYYLLDNFVFSSKTRQ